MHPVPDRVKPSFVIFDVRALWRSGLSVRVPSWASECPDVKNYKWRLNPVGHRMHYSCTRMATVGFKGLKHCCCDRLLIEWGSAYCCSPSRYCHNSRKQFRCRQQELGMSWSTHWNVFKSFRPRWRPWMTLTGGVTDDSLSRLTGSERTSPGPRGTLTNGCCVNSSPALLSNRAGHRTRLISSASAL